MGEKKRKYFYILNQLDTGMYKKIFYYTLFAVILLSCKHKTKVIYVNSYHKGYPSSDSIEYGLNKTIKNAEMRTFYLDSKKQQNTDSIQRKSSAILETIRTSNPDLVILSDDNAMKFLIDSLMLQKSLPVIFCGVNWSAQKYIINMERVTGMLEVLPLKEMLSIILKQYPRAETITILSEYSQSEINNKEILDTLFRNTGLTPNYQLAEDYAEWKDFFIQANQSSDLIYFSTNGAIKNWEDSLAVAFVEENIKIPVVTCDDFMMPYCVYGMTKIASEQGEWVGETANRILAGDQISEIPITANSKSKTYINTDLAKKINFKTDITSYLSTK